MYSAYTNLNKKIRMAVGTQGRPWTQSRTRSVVGSAWAGSSTSSAPRRARPWPAATAPVGPAPGSPSARAPAPCHCQWRPLCTTAASAPRPPALRRQRPTSCDPVAPRTRRFRPPPACWAASAAAARRARRAPAAALPPNSSQFASTCLNAVPLLPVLFFSCLVLSLLSSSPLIRMISCSRSRRGLYSSRSCSL
jgi:hypothetical protein